MSIFYCLSWRYFRLRRIVTMLVIISVIVVLRYRMKNDMARLDEKSKKNWKIVELQNQPPKLVLFYTTLFGRTPWPTIENDYRFTNWNNIPCGVRNCKISYDKQQLNKSDAVIFHGQDLGSLNLSELSKKVSKRGLQRWVFFLHENPLFFTYDLTPLHNVFNWTMTYKLTSDIFVPYFYYFLRKKNKDLKKDINENENYARDKDRLVAWMVSHCGKLRDKFVKKLMEYIPVHVYGGCSSKFSQRRACDRHGNKSCLKILRRYKFYLAFENANCVDYITEKYWLTSLQNTVVPVVLGGGNYSNGLLAVPGSFVNAMDFSSVKDLADVLIMLDKNDTAYNEYFAWRKLYYIAYPPSWTCQLCSMLNNATLPVKTYNRESFAEFWSSKTNCGFLDEKVERMFTSVNLTVE